jgi:hypothetical protein
MRKIEHMLDREKGIVFLNLITVDVHNIVLLCSSNVKKILSKDSK